MARGGARVVAIRCAFCGLRTSRRPRSPGRRSRAVGVAIEFAADVLDGEILQLAREFRGAFV